MSSVEAPTRRSLARSLAWLAPVVLVYVGVIVVPTWTRVAQHCFHYFDLGIYAQALYELSPRTPNPFLAARHVRIFNDHFDPILFLATPFTWVLPQPYGAMLAEQAAYASALAALVWLHRRGRLGTRGLVLAASLLLLSIATLSAVGFPVHPGVWAVAPATWAAALLIEDRRRAALVCFALLFACKEEMPFIGIAAGAVMLARGERWLGGWVLGLAAAWAGFAVVLRPLLLGETENYLGVLLAGLREAPVDALLERLAIPPANLIVLLTLASFAPLVAWAASRRLAPVWPIAAGLLPMLGIRFLGKYWSHHYMAPVVGVAVAALLGVLVKREPPRWLAALTLAALALPVTFSLVSHARVYANAELLPPACPADPARLQRIDAALARARREPGRKLIGGNLLVGLPPSDDTFFPGGSHPPDTLDLVLVEKPPRGDPFPLTHARMAELIDTWRRSATWILIDDQHLFMARGRFVDR